MNRKIPLALLLVWVAGASGCTAGPGKDYSAFATCVKDAGIVEYGAYWCPNCARVKLTLGEAWKNLAYVECDPKCVPGADGKLPDYCRGFTSQTGRCLAIGVDKYPSWVRSDEILYVGTDLAQVAGVSGCTLPS